MGYTTLTDSEYTFDASAQTITLAKPYDTLSLGQIISIKNLTKNVIIFDKDVSKMDKIEKYTSYSLSLSGSVITHFCTSSDFADTDKLAIVIDTELDFVDLKTVLLENTSVVAGELVASDPFDILGTKDVAIFVQSTKNFTFYIQVSDDSAEGCAWFDLCDDGVNPITLPCEGKGSPVVASGKSLKKNIKAMQMRILVKNNDTASDTPYVGVM